jgi:hypothetical protein
VSYSKQKDANRHRQPSKRSRDSDEEESDQKVKKKQKTKKAKSTQRASKQTVKVISEESEESKQTVKVISEESEESKQENNESENETEHEKEASYIESSMQDMLDHKHTMEAGKKEVINKPAPSLLDVQAPALDVQSSQCNHSTSGWDWTTVGNSVILELTNPLFSLERMGGTLDSS